MSGMVERPRYWYQQEAVDAVMRCIANGGGNPICEMPTGSGKSITMAKLSDAMRKQWGARILIVAHRDKLVKQNARAMREMIGAENVGIYAAGIGIRDRHHSVIVAMRDSVHARMHELGRFDAVIIDECHIQGAKIRAIVEHVIAQNPDARIIGFSATLYVGPRAEPLTMIDDAIFTSIAYTIDVKTLIDESYLVAPIPGESTAQIDMTGVPLVAGEFHAGESERRSDTDEINAACATDVINALNNGRRAAMVFGVSVKHCVRLRARFEARGMRCAIIDGKTPETERDRIFANVENGALRVLLSCGVLTTGIDLPIVDVVAEVFATNIPSKHVQVVGRGMRTYKHGVKTDCVVFDYGKNTERLGPIDNIKRREKRGEATRKECPRCHAANHNSAKQCKECGAPFPIVETEATDDERMTRMASTAPIVEALVETIEHNGRKVKVSRWVVDAMTTSEHIASTACLRVDYWGVLHGGRGDRSCIASEFLPIESTRGTSIVGKFCREHKWKRPHTMREALSTARDIARPVSIATIVDGKYRKIVDKCFTMGEQASLF
ncbi:MAG: DEAD/DEAH box helicase [Desulfurellales bacterium]|nr:MAG: DEAD/DEAH box helicase [Desulfurellales bacterium]